MSRAGTDVILPHVFLGDEAHPLKPYLTLREMEIMIRKPSLEYIQASEK